MQDCARSLADERSARAMKGPSGADGRGRLDYRIRDEEFFSLDLFEACSRRPRPVAV